jgi:hypothetical protein
MADVDMTDAPGPSSKKTTDSDGKTDGKKRFEVKKVSLKKGNDSRRESIELMTLV